MAPGDPGQARLEVLRTWRDHPWFGGRHEVANVIRILEGPKKGVSLEEIKLEVVSSSPLQETIPKAEPVDFIHKKYDDSKEKRLYLALGTPPRAASQGGKATIDPSAKHFFT